MTWGGFETLFKAGCKHINESHKSASVNTINIIGTGDALVTAFAGIDGNKDVAASIKAERATLNGLPSSWRKVMDPILAYGGTQLGVPSKFVAGGKVLDFVGLMRDINADMETNSRSIALKETTLGADPTADDDGIINRVPIDVNGEAIEAGIHAQTLDVEVTGNRATGLGTWQSEVTISARNQGKDIFDKVAPSTNLVLPATNPGNNKNSIVSNPNLINGIDSRVDAALVTQLTNWTLSGTGASTHAVDTSIKFRDNVLSHKFTGTGGVTRIFTQNMKLKSKQTRRTPHAFFVPVFKTSTPTGNITIAWGSKSQVFTIASLSAGWNYLIIDRDQDTYPDNFDEADAKIVITVENTTGSGSAYVNIGCILGTIAEMWNGVGYFHWSANGTSQLNDKKTIVDSQTSAGKNATALSLAYDFHPSAALRATGSPTLADYT